MGDRVRTSAAAVPHHTRLPAYARGCAGTVVGVEGRWPLADARAQGAVVVQPVYTVRFSASELFGAGSHSVTLSMWEEYLT
ncbi:SH3-like domain-containing protein [Lentzea tibetensis]|uniref:SH3-like domain-containing protein n=1 Tax=Lentzea tibetensis TaxID=2591470 RepID=UPI001C992335|nr:SH3-like domain-containing protein [Lentzea tibetensis]